MGRSSRKETLPADRDGLQPGGNRIHWTDQHPDSRHWTPHQRALARMMTQAAYEGLYGRGSAPAEPEQSAPTSPFFPDAPERILARLGQEPISSADRLALLETMRLPDGMNAPESDPVLRALWKSECLRAEEEMEAFQEAGVTHWMEGLSGRELVDLRGVWFREVLGDLRHKRVAGAGGRKVTGPPVTRSWWESNEDARFALEAGASSIGAAAMRAGLWSRADMAGIMATLRSTDSELGAKFFEENILPEGAYLSQRRDPHKNQPDRYDMPPAEFCEEVWHALRARYDNPDGTDIAADFEALSRAIARGGGDKKDFAWNPVAEEHSAWKDSDPDIFREALHGFSWSGSGKEQMVGAAEYLLLAEIVRISYGPGQPQWDASDRSRKEWEAYSSDRSAPFPLRHLRPLFVGLGKAELLDELERDLASSSWRPVSDPLRNGLLNYFKIGSLGKDLEGLPEQIVRVVRKETAP